MAIGLTVVGRVRQLFASRAPTPQELLIEIQRWLDAAALPAYDGSSLSGTGGSHTLAVRLHPAAEPLTFTMPRPGIITASALTSGPGPGYHEYVCELLAAAGRDLAISWTTDGETYLDSTGYFERADRTSLESHMIAWLGASMRRTERMRTAGAAQLALSLPPGFNVVHGAAIATPLGPRDDAWIATTSADPSSAVDIFPWWSRDTDARFRLGRALCRMWCDVYWRPPIDEAEMATMQLVLDDLAAAYALDPALPYPTAEWAELADLLGVEAPIAGPPSSPALPTVAGPELEAAEPAGGGADREPIGYRRGLVRLDYGRWSIVLPGAIAVTASSDGLRGTDGLRTLTLSTIAMPAGAPVGEAFLAAYRGNVVPAGGIPKRVVADAVISEAGLERRPEGPVLRAHAIAGTRVAALEMALADDSDVDWALDVWRSIRFRSGG